VQQSVDQHLERTAHPGSQWRKTARNIWTIAALALLLAPIGVTLVGLAVDPESATQADLQSRLNLDPAQHPWGVDALGRDLQARVLRGALTTLGIATLAAALAFVPAGLFGALSGWLAARRKLWSESLADLLLLPADVLLFIPAVLSAMSAWLLLTEPSWLTLGLIVAIVLLPRAVRLSQTLWLAAPQHRRLTLGAAGSGSLFLGLLFAAIGLTATLEFLGLGTPPPEPSLGAILNEGLTRMAADPSAVQAAAVVLWLCAFPCYTAADALAGFFYSKEALVRLNE
jgi:peptide/nickel transport system permease protein